MVRKDKQKSAHKTRYFKISVTFAQSEDWKLCHFHRCSDHSPALPVQS